jgi:hypothetical protein
MRQSNWTPSIVPNEADETDYLVADDFGKTGRAWREADVETTDLGCFEKVGRPLNLGTLRADR